MNNEIEVNGLLFTLLGDEDVIASGDIALDCGGKWRGPITADWDGVGFPVSRYTKSNTEGVQPPVRYFARPSSRSTEDQS